MKKEHLKLLDFILPILSEKFPNGEHLSTLTWTFKEKFDIEITNQERELFRKLYEYEYFESKGNVGMILIIPEIKEIIDKYGLLSNYIKEQVELIKKDNEVKDEERRLNLENLELQNENIKYQKTNRERQFVIDKLTKTNLEQQIEINNYLKSDQAQKSEIDGLLRQNLILQNRQLRRNTLFTIIGFASGFILSKYNEIWTFLKPIFSEWF